MTLLFRILRAVHANGTHHKLALDALTHLKGPDADDWRRLFLNEAEIYLEGSKAPDKEFKDFKNHVLHVRDNLWGGAPVKARSWYNHLVEALSARNWEMAVYCAGVLSHYYTDPVQPFHTAQSDAESNIHRAVEWSISKSYDKLYREALPAFTDAPTAQSDDPNWLAEMVVAGATHSNQYYESLIAHYNISQGVVDPPAGLDPIAQQMVGDLLVYAATGFAVILERAIAEAGVTPPRVGLSVATVLAALTTPIRWITNKMEDRAEAALVQAMYDELRATGRVDKTLPEDDRAIRDAYNEEIGARWRRIPTSKRFPLPVGREKKAVLPNRRSAIPVSSEAEAPEARIEIAAPAAPQSGNLQTEAAAVAARTAEPAADDATVASKPGSLAQSLSQLQPRPTLDSGAASDKAIAAPSLPQGSVPDIAPRLAAERPAGSGNYHLSLGDEIVDAPSIGPKTADELAKADIWSVRDLLNCDPVGVAATVNRRHITPETIIDWQDQARLVCTVPGLRGSHAQVLVGAGYRDPETITNTEQTVLLADILRFAGTKEGQRVLRNGQPPDVEKVLAWIGQARRANLSRAA